MTSVNCSRIVPGDCQQAEVYREEALRQMKGLTKIASGAVYALVGLLIIVVILRMVMSIGGVYSDAMKGL